MTDTRIFPSPSSGVRGGYKEYTVYCNYLTQNSHEIIVTLMLQRTSMFMSLLVLALAGPGMAVAQSGLVPASFGETAPADMSASASRALEGKLLAIANQTRTANALAPFSADAGLAAVARAHARDMAVRGYVGYADTSGLSLLDQVRVTDRTALIGSFGSSIAVLDSSATAAEVHAAIQSDPANAENLRRGFDHAGVGIHEADGRLYVVQLFARIDGQLDQPLPMQLTEATLLEASLAGRNMTPVGWSVSDASGDVLARGSGRRIQSSSREPLQGYLNLDVAVGTDVYTLRGPYVQVYK